MKRSAPWRLTVGLIFGLLSMALAADALAFVTPRLKPPAPGPSYMSRIDHVHLKAVAHGLKRKQFSKARVQIASIKDPIARSLGEWMYYSAEDPAVDIAKAGKFFDAHQDWPAADRLQSFVEKRISNTAPVNKILAFYESREPISGEGKIQLARALIAEGKIEAGKIYLREAWINHNFKTAAERRILSTFKPHLTKQDHTARVDRLLWARQVTNARRIIPKLETRERRKAEARVALILSAANAQVLYRNLTNDERLDSGVLLAAVRYFRRAGEHQYAISLTEHSPKDPKTLRNSNRWWYERQLLMRWALKGGRFADAYKAASNHGLEPGGDFADAEFNAGWIALRFLNDPKRAKIHFLALASAVGSPISVSRAYYWLGRTAEASGEDALSTAYYLRASQFYYSYYGQLAAEELGGRALEKRFAAPHLPTSTERALFASRPTVAALRMLSDLNMDYEFMVFAYHVDDQLERPGEYVELATLTNGEGAPHLTVRAGKVAIQKDAFTPEVAYPVMYVPERAKRYVEPEIILGLSRQESEFNPRAYSRAGARGVMQLIPTTAQITARKEGLRYSRTALLDDPFYNITLGSAHLSHLIDRFDGSLVMTFAAYNAGASRVDRWVREYGDPRSPAVDPVDWVELIPFSETRNYVQRVLENIQVYRGRLNNAPIPGLLTADLERGGPKQRSAVVTPPSGTLATLSKNFNTKNLPPIPENTVRRANLYAAAMTRTADSEQTNAPMTPYMTTTIPRRTIPSRDTSRMLSKPPSRVLTGNGAVSRAENIAPANSHDLSTPAARMDEFARRMRKILGTPSPSSADTPAAQTPENDQEPPPVTADPETSAPTPTDVPDPAHTLTTDAAVIPAANTDDSAREACLAYRAFLAEKADDNANTSDLINAELLAELQSSAASCS